jgi:hypothetical protein
MTGRREALAVDKRGPKTRISVRMGVLSGSAEAGSARLLGEAGSADA